MKVLKFTMIWAVLLSAGSFAVVQSGYSEYLDLARENLKSGNCDAAQKYYNVYKELANKSVSSLEVLIEDCKATSANGPKRVQINYQNYEVLPGDLGGKFEWQEAKSACANLTAFGKSDWYLPDKSELDGLYKRKDEIGGFTGDEYWSSSEYVSYWTSFDNVSHESHSAWIQCFSSGYQSQVYYKSYNLIRVRCVRKN